jgi:agmatinase
LSEFFYASGTTVIHAEELPGLGIEAVILEAKEIVGEGPTYLSFDVDNLDPALFHKSVLRDRIA